MCLEWQILRHDIGELIFGVNVEDLSSTVLDELPDVMITNVDMLGTTVMSRIDGKKDATIVVGTHGSWSGGLESKFLKECTKPGDLSS